MRLVLDTIRMARLYRGHLVDVISRYRGGVAQPARAEES